MDGSFQLRVSRLQDVQGVQDVQTADRHRPDPPYV